MLQQSMFQPGFGTNPQQVRQDIAQDLAYSNAGSQMGGFGGVQAGYGAQAMFQPGYAGTNAQAVKQNMGQTGFGFGSGAQFGAGSQSGNQMSLGPAASVLMSPGFAGTNVQKVRQDIAQESGYGIGATSQFGGTQYGNVNQQSNQFGQFGFGAQAMFQPGFAGTNEQSVRQDIARESGYGMGMGMGMGSQFSGQFGTAQGTGQGAQFMAMGLGGQGTSQGAVALGPGAQALMSPGFAGTNVQSVRQDIARESGYGMGMGGQFSGQFGTAQGTGQGAQFMAMSQGGQGTGQAAVTLGPGAQALMSPGFAGTNVQSVRQDIARESGYGMGMGSQFSGQFGTAQGTGQGAQFMAMSQGGQGTDQGAVTLGPGAQALMSPGFAGTNVQSVRQDIARESGYGMNMSGFAGTNAQSTFLS
ncbi:hypothetical protein [Effusibacillus dendaii]|uniref:Uncharacterized protein n=1 Tax=Effusibacillus dendaii TaxID=2743772 RepID=A0A7I8DFR2_9BACL|nr:hypothetical protein [Effusibacillus dendaii]BCJ88152.1 hypothetical protein skT53_31370 [Effusibacillus dendaii]